MIRDLDCTEYLRDKVAQCATTVADDVAVRDAANIPNANGWLLLIAVAGLIVLLIGVGHDELRKRHGN